MDDVSVTRLNFPGCGTFEGLIWVRSDSKCSCLVQSQMMNFGLLTWRKIHPHQLPNQVLGADISVLLPSVHAPAVAFLAAGDKCVFLRWSGWDSQRKRNTFFLNYFVSSYVTGGFVYKSVSPGLGVICAADSWYSSGGGRSVVVHRIADLISHKHNNQKCSVAPLIQPSFVMLLFFFKVVLQQVKYSTRSAWFGVTATIFNYKIMFCS